MRIAFSPPFITLAVVLFVTHESSAQGYSPEEAAARMTAPEGFAVDLVAAEPLVRQPVAIDFDDRGRLWVLQYLQYPNPAGLKRVKVDRYSRTTYDRVPKPPPHGPRGADKLTILEDTNGDGRMDRAKDFVDGLNLSTGFAIGYGGVFVMQVPYLLFYPDRNRDDVPDGDPQVLLKGFGMEDTSSLANSLTWGVDGWLYGTQGTNLMANIRGIEFEQGVWRYHPLTKAFELFCEGGGNSWGLDFDRRGNLFYSTNHGGYVMHHGVQGAYYEKSFGKHGELHNPFAFGYFPHVLHKNFRGGHVTVGGFVYQGEAFPAAFRNKYVGADLLGHGMYWHTITPDGATFRTAYEGTLLKANDTWFAPSDATLGPDGAVYIADWHDQRTAHPDPDATWDRSNGRVFRVRYDSFTAPALPDPCTQTSAELVEWLKSGNVWKSRRARRVLAERQQTSVHDLLKRKLEASEDEDHTLNLLWTLYSSGGFTQRDAPKLLKHCYASVRSWTVRFLSDQLGEELAKQLSHRRQLSSDITQQLLQLAKTEKDFGVISQLACTAKRLPAADGVRLAHNLAGREQFYNERYIPLLLWWAVERHAMPSRRQVLESFASPEGWESPLIANVILGRLMRRYAGDGTPTGLAACAELLNSAPNSDEKRRMILELDEGLKMLGRKRLPGLPSGTLFAGVAAPRQQQSKGEQRPQNVPPALAQALSEFWNRDTTDPTVIRVAARLGEATALKKAVSLAQDKSLAVPQRIEMLAILDELGTKANVAAVASLLFDREQETNLRLAVLKTIGRHADAAVQKKLLDHYPQFEKPIRAKARSVLLSRETSAWELLAKIDRGEVPSEEVSLEELRQTAVHQSQRLDKLVRKHWGGVRAGTPEEKLAEMRRLNNDLRAGSNDVAAGKQLFQKHCANCHRLFGEGGQIGPDLTRANRHDLTYLLVSLVDPSSQIRKEFLSYVAQTDDGRIITGLLIEDTPARVTLLTAKNEKVTIGRDDLDALQASPVSLMPDNLHKELAPQQLRDLFGYLQIEPANP